jgi:prepilin-type N-terminal cleavage/methylation domain-containing protein/prepilin-type processing-associated H-X9-DG protein
MTRRKSGFTLIELLVVIAIIAILAAMLFPVFARARESARKIQCLANVKNIAIAVQMYLTDYDRLWPKEHRPEVQADFMNLTGCSMTSGAGQYNLDRANPYLRAPVILDEYIKNRDVWRCPSSPRYLQFGVLNPRGGDWWQVSREYKAVWGSYSLGGCSQAFPPGWGGTITDSALQETQAVSAGAWAAEGAFLCGYMTTACRETKTSEMDDPTKFLVISDGAISESFLTGADVAYPDICALDCAGPYCGRGADWANCSSTQQCGAGTPLFVTDVEYRKEHARPRHMGGENLGFADGHAAWASSESILNGMPDGTWRPVSDAQRTADSQRDNLITGGLPHGGLCGFM